MISKKTFVLQIKKAVKKFVSYSIEGEYKVYRLKHTPFLIKKQYTKEYHENYEKLSVIPNKIIFDNYMGKGYGCNGKYVTEELLKSNRDYDIVWTVKNAKEQEMQFPQKVRLVEYGSKEAMKEYATAGLWVQNYQLVHYLNKGLLKKAEQTYIQMWHGSFGIKKIEGNCTNLTNDKNWTILAKKNSDYTDYWISNSSFETDVYRNAFWNVKNVLEYGHARNDIFFIDKTNQIKEIIYTKYKFQNKKLLLYVPTFRDDGMEWEQTIDYESLKDALSARFGGEWQILIRLHPRMREYADKMIPKQTYLTDVTEYSDIQELLAAADVVITDYSSAIFDFILTGKPAFLYATDYVNYQNMRGLYYPLEQTPFPLATDNKQLKENIENFDEKEYKKKTELFLKQKGSAENGTAAKKTAELIESIVERKESEL